MLERPTFFLPYVSPDQQEDVYEFLAGKHERAVPSAGKRVYSITFELQGTFWTATVGRHLEGRKPAMRRQKAIALLVADASLILAIFPGDPYCVVTDSDPRSGFTNPFYAVTPTAVEYFSWPLG